MSSDCRNDVFAVGRLYGVLAAMAAAELPPIEALFKNRPVLASEIGLLCMDKTETGLMRNLLLRLVAIPAP